MTVSGDRRLGLCKLNTLNTTRKLIFVYHAANMELIVDNVSRCVSINLETAPIEITYRKHAKWKHVNFNFWNFGIDSFSMKSQTITSQKSLLHG